MSVKLLIDGDADMEKEDDDGVFADDDDVNVADLLNVGRARLNDGDAFLSGDSVLALRPVDDDVDDFFTVNDDDDDDDDFLLTLGVS